MMVIGYGIVQLAYSFWLKQVVIVDVMTLVDRIHPSCCRRCQRG